jgi:hypothetical protein|nr:MAG TPA: hypothetical protein [Caudoviricetes sp.]
MSRLIDKIDYNTQVKIGNMWYIAKPVGKDSLKFRIKSAIEVLKGKAIADKLEKEYSAMLTESDENECDYKRVLKENEELLEVKVSTSAHNRILELEKENEELTISNKEIDKECSRLEEKEVKLINENEHYKDLIYALKTYYDITEEDLEKCIKNDR